MVKNSDEREHQVVLSLGTNLGQRQLNLKKALIQIEKQIGVINKQSSFYETEAWGREDLLPFLNIVVMVCTNRSPKELLQECLLIEKDLGRTRNISGTYENRLMDIDIVYYANMRINQPDIKIPHPLMHKRAFVLIPLVEVAPDQFHPSLGKTNKQLLEELEEPTQVRRLDSPI